MKTTTLFAVLFLAFGSIALMAQTESPKPAKKRMIIEKISITKNGDEETITKSIDTLEGEALEKHLIHDGDVEIIMKDMDGNLIREEKRGGQFHIVPVSPEGHHGQIIMKEMRTASPNKAVLGVQLENVEGENGAQVIEVFEGSAAEKVGIQEGDIILSIQGKETKSVDAVIDVLSGNKPGDKVKVSVLRGTKIKTLKATLQERKEEVMSMERKASCKTMMACCKGMDKEKCKKMSKEECEKMMKEMGCAPGAEGQKKLFIIKKDGDQEMRIENGDGETIIHEIKKMDGDGDLEKERIIQRKESQSLNVEYLTSSPNPSSGRMKISFAGTAVPTVVQVLDLNGKEVYSEKLDSFDGTYNKEIDIQNEAKGTLILNIIQGEKIISEKIFVK
ncbi:MAG TPA: PDZ domain-containing protein [Saprospiraceae bacterium]|nr:PDZ domain-containing protein [Saprospiraceae bacterium]